MSAIDFSAMKRRNRNRLASVSALVMRSSRDRKLWSKPSLVDHPPAAPAPGRAGAEGEDDDHRAEQGARGLGESSRSRRLICEADDCERGGEDDLRA